MQAKLVKDKSLTIFYLNIYILFLKIIEGKKF